MNNENRMSDFGFPEPSDRFMSLGEIPRDIPRMDVPHVDIDPVTFAVIGGAFFSACQQMDVTIRNTAMTPVVNIGRDYSCCIFTSDAQLIAQTCNCPGHVGSMHFAVISCIRRFRDEGIHDGDVFILNDPYRGGTHLPDITFITPVFYDDELVMFAGNRAHHSDIGGGSGGSLDILSAEIFQEGIRFPPVKFVERGTVSGAIMDILLTNVRTPKEVEGDMEAQLAANNIGTKRLHDLLKKYGKDVVLNSAQKYLEHSERAFIKSLNIADGTYEAIDWMDGDGVNETPQKIRVAVTIKGNKAFVDFTGTDGQSNGSANCMFPVTASMLVFAFLSMTDPTIMPNHGFYRPIHVKAPEGTLVNTRFPGAVVGYSDIACRIVEVIMEALTPAIPERVIAATSGTSTNTAMSGVDPKTGEHYVISNINSQGGWGGRATADGWHNVCFVEANGWDIPVETTEYRFPWRIIAYRLRDDTMGAGKWRGGSGNYLALTPVEHTAVLTVNGDRATTPPYGIFGGKPGTTAKCTIHRKTGEVERISPLMMKQDKIPVYKEDIVVIEAPSGGGYGNPLERDANLVQNDVRDHLISMEIAEKDYGVVINPKTLDIDKDATGVLRQKMWQEFNTIKDSLPVIDRAGYQLKVD